MLDKNGNVVKRNGEPQERNPKDIKRMLEKVCPRCKHKKSILPLEYATQVMIVDACVTLRTLPKEGGLLDQPKWFWELYHIYQEKANVREDPES